MYIDLFHCWFESMWYLYIIRIEFKLGLINVIELRYSNH